MIDEATVRGRINRVVDPCSVAAGAPVGIADLGLVRELHLDETEAGVAIRATIGVTEPGCMMGASFAVRARQELEQLAGVASVEVELDHRADWSPADIDPLYAARLEEVRAERRRRLGDRRRRRSGFQ